jgi:two-component system response regulator AtoC
VVSATARDLQAEVASGRFREDLFFRLNVFTVQLPPLRERLDDLPLLADRFVHSCSVRIGREPAPRLTSDALRQLLSYHWPGNVRELENVIERSLVLCDGDQLKACCLAAADAPAGGQGGSDNLSIKQAERMMEMDLIRRALERTGGNRTHAAKLLEISHRSLLYKLKEYLLE